MRKYIKIDDEKTGGHSHNYLLGSVEMDEKGRCEMGNLDEKDQIRQLLFFLTLVPSSCQNLARQE
jgi:hypothetical protein